MHGHRSGFLIFVVFPARQMEQTVDDVERQFVLLRGSKTRTIFQSQDGGEERGNNHKDYRDKWSDQWAEIGGSAEFC